MTTQFLAWRRRLLPGGPAGNGSIVCGYLTLYFVLDRISLVQELPGIGLTLWNPPPASSIAFLIIRDLRFTPVVFVAGVAANGLIDGFPLGVPATLVTNAIIATGYALAAAALRNLAHAGQGFPRVTDVIWLFLIATAATTTVTAAVAATLMIMNIVQEGLFFITARHLLIGDLTGIISLLPALLAIPQAWERWKEVPRNVRAGDLGVFVLGLGLALFVVFGGTPSKGPEFFYFLLLPVIWAGVRHGLPWCAIAILVEQLAIIATISVLDYPMADFLDYQILVLVIAAMGLILGGVVTERQRTERQLRRQQAELSRTARLTTAGALGTAVVHELSQPLATVATYVHTCRRLLAKEKADLEVLDGLMANVEAQIGRAGKIIDRLRNYLGGSEPRWSSIDLVDITRRMVDVLNDEARANTVTIQIDARPLPRIAADRIQIEQILINLIRNAIEAAADQDSDNRLVQIRLRQFDHEIQVAVEDNGHGVSSAIAERLFKPFETSKPRGMGLGLSLSREMAKAHGGRLWWDSTAVTGARFILRLPRDRVEDP